MLRKFKIILIFAIALFIGNFSHANAADIFVTPALGNYTVGQRFSVDIYVSSPSVAINAVSGILSFPSDSLEVTSISKAGTIMSLWVQEPTFSNQAGTVNFEGVVLNPGFTGSSAKVLTVNFRAKGYGLADTTFSSASILANDGTGTNVLKSISGGHYNINTVPQTPANAEVTTPSIAANSPTAPTIVSTTHQDPNQWYPKNIATFTWGPLPDGITEVRTLLNKSPNSLPTVSNPAETTEKTVTDIPEGTSYFHVQLKSKKGLGSISHFKINVDTVPPAPFKINVLNNQEASDPSPIVSFITSDNTSGIEKYQAKIGDGDFFNISNSAVAVDAFMLPKQLPGKRTLLIQAIDKAGNKTVSYTEINVLPIDPPKVNLYSDSLKSGDLLSMDGTTYPDSSVYVFLTKAGADEERRIVRSDPEGRFSFVWPKVLEEGKYKVYLQAVDKRGAVSENSIVREFNVAPGVLIQLGPIKTNNVYVGMFLLVIFIASLIGGISGWYINFKHGHEIHRYSSKGKK